MKFNRSILIAAALAALTSSTPPAAEACFKSAAWTAPLTATPGVHTSHGEGGIAGMAFDPEKALGTITVMTKNIHDISRIEVRFIRTRGDVDGPVMAVVYDKSQGPCTAKLSKRLNGSDLLMVPKYKVLTPIDVANCMTENRATVVVCTRRHPKGEVAGVIGLRPVIIYSPDKVGSYHDPSLHKDAARNHQKSST